MQPPTQPIPPASMPQPAPPPSAHYGGPTLTGPPPKSRAPWIILGILAVALVASSIIAALLLTFDDDADGDEQRRLRERTTGTGQLGDTMVDGKAEFVVRSVDCGLQQIGTEPTVLSANEGSQFCVVGITVKNRTDDPYTLFESGQRITTVHGDDVEAASYAGFVNDGDMQRFTSIPAGETVTGDLVFEISQDTAISRVKLNDDPFKSGKGVTIGAV